MIDAQNFRDLINLLEDMEHLDEAGAGPARILSHIHDGAVFFMISAMRGNLKHQDNLKRTAALKATLARLPFSFIEVEGEYHEEGQPTPLPEQSFFVMPRQGDRKVSLQAFQAFAVKLMQAYDQDSILFGDGRIARLIFADGSTHDLGDTATLRLDVIKNLGGFSSIRGRKFSFTDAETAGQPAVGPDGQEMPSRTTGVRYGGRRA